MRNTTTLKNKIVAGKAGVFVAEEDGFGLRPNIEMALINMCIKDKYIQN